MTYFSHQATYATIVNVGELVKLRVSAIIKFPGKRERPSILIPLIRDGVKAEVRTQSIQIITVIINQWNYYRDCDGNLQSGNLNELFGSFESDLTHALTI